VAERGVSDRINEHLLEERDQAVEQLKKVERLLERPVNVTIQSSEEATLKKIGEYLPQLTHMATNLAHVASAIQAVNTTLMTATAKLEQLAKIIEEK
jgi:hypothetical protein